MWRNLRLAAARELIIWLISLQLPNMQHWYSMVVFLVCINQLITIFCSALFQFTAYFFIFFQLPSTVLYACRVIKNYAVMFSCFSDSTSQKLNCCGAVERKTTTNWWKFAMPPLEKQVDSTTLRDFWLAANYITMRIFISFSSRLSPIVFLCCTVISG